MITKDNYQELLKTKEINAYEFRDIVGKLLKAYQNKEIEYFIFDIETKGLDILSPSCNLIGFSFADPINKIGYFVGHTHPEFLISENDKSLIISCLFKLLYNIPCVGHNLKFDLSYLVARFNLDMKRVVIQDDTLFMSYYYYGAKRDTGISLSLKSIFRHLFGVDLVWEEELTAALMAHKRIADRHFNNVPYQTISTYGAYDSIATYYLRLGLIEKLKTRTLTAYGFLIKSIHVFVDLETTGISLDWEFRDYLLKCYREKIQKFEDQFQNTSIIQSWKEDHFQEFNLNSIKMIGEILYGKDYYGCPVLSKTDKGAPSTNEAALLELVAENKGRVPSEAKEFIKELLGNRNSVKMVTTYLEPLDERRVDEKYIPQYLITGTATGRLCFVGETKISLLNGEEKRLDELEKGSEFYVYSCKEDGEIVPTKAVSLGETKKVNKLIEVTLDNGSTESCTPDHLWMLRDGTYCEAQNLKEGDSLMPLYKRLTNIKGNSGYVEFLDNKLNSWKNSHSVVNLRYNSDYLFEVEERIKLKRDRFTISHHIDFNKLNNNPENLLWMGEHEHWKYHSSLAKLKWGNKDYKEKFAKSMSELFKMEKYQNFFSNHNRNQLLKRWQNPDYIKYMSESMSRTWTKPGFRDLMVEVSRNTMNKLWEDPEYRKMQTKAHKKMWEDPEHRRKMKEISSAHIKEQQKDPYFCAQRDAAARITLAKSRENPEWVKNNKRALRRGGFTAAQKIFNWILENNLELNKENYDICPIKKSNYPSFKKAISYLEIGEVTFKKNHKVKNVRVIITNELIPVYDISIIDGPSNFALSSGVFVKNSSFFHTLPSGNDVKRLVNSTFMDCGGVVIASDFAQLEVKIISALSGDPTLKELYLNNYDVHSYVASIMFKVETTMVSKKMRKEAKAIVFGILYGKGAHSISEELEIPKEEAQKLMDYFFLGFPLVKRWIDKQHSFLKVNKYVTTPFGRVRYLPDIDSPEWKKQSEALRAAQNSPIQSTASDLAFSAAIRIYYELRDNNYKSKFVGTVHDSIIVDAHPDEIQKVLSIMYYHMNTYINTSYDFLNGLPISSDFEVGTSWGGSCAISKFNEDVWVLSGHQLDADNLVERLKMKYPNIKVSEFIEQPETEDKILKFVNPGRKVKFKIVWS